MRCVLRAARGQPSSFTGVRRRHGSTHVLKVVDACVKSRCSTRIRRLPLQSTLAVVCRDVQRLFGLQRIHCHQAQSPGDRRGTKALPQKVAHGVSAPGHQESPSVSVPSDSLLYLLRLRPTEVHVFTDNVAGRSQTLIQVCTMCPTAFESPG